MIKIIRILHVCAVRIKISIPWVTIWHHEALPNRIQRDGIFYMHRTLMIHSFSCIPFYFQYFILKEAFITIHRTFWNLTSVWRQHNNKVTWRPIQPMHTEFSWKCSFFLSYPLVRYMGKIRISIPSENFWLLPFDRQSWFQLTTRIILSIHDRQIHKLLWTIIAL